MPPARPSARLAEAQAGPALASRRLTALLGFHLRMASAAVARDFKAATADFGLTQKQFAVLSLVEENPGVAQVDVGAFLDTDRATTMALVDRLEQRGLLVRRSSTRDRRRVALHLTPAGSELLQAAGEAAEAHEAKLFEDISPADRDQLRRLLLHASLGPR